MAFKVFNTLSRSLEEFVPAPRDGVDVRLYCCGPTVHDFAHIGNFRTFVFADLTRRHLEYRGHSTRHVMNITDVDDKIIRRAVEAGESLVDFTREKERAFWEDFRSLRCLAPHATPHATEHIGEIIELIGRLMEQGLAYAAADGSVYFSIGEYQKQGLRYGRLARLVLEEMRAGERVRSDEYEKEAAADFALWKARAPEDAAVFWPSPWGEGRPGWHIECSAMSMRFLGPSFDLHLGGEDLIFPHHEDEIAQSEGARLQPEGRPFVRYWMHAAHLLVEGKKMSKSLGNFYTVRDLLSKGFTGREIRSLLLSSHYREPFNFTLDGLHGARSSLQRLDECLEKLSEAKGDREAAPEPTVLEKVGEALDDDLNVSAAWGAVFEWVRELNRAWAEGSMTADRAASAWAAWERLDAVFAVGADRQDGPPPEILALAEKRQAARKAKDFATADAIRAQISEQGWKLEDAPGGPKVRRL